MRHPHDKKKTKLSLNNEIMSPKMKYEVNNEMQFYNNEKINHNHDISSHNNTQTK